MKKSLILLCSILALGSCTKKNPIDTLEEKTKYYLMGDDESQISFLGWPNIKTDKPSCEASEMGQGYRFKIKDGVFFIESIRPSGVEKHIISSVESSDDKIIIKAKNNANLPFKLIISNISDEDANISFDGEANSLFARCIR